MRKNSISHLNYLRNSSIHFPSASVKEGPITEEGTKEISLKEKGSSRKVGNRKEGEMVEDSRAENTLEDIIKSIPQKMGVYFLLDAHGEPLYIGKAKNLRERIKDHYSSPGLRERKIISLTKDIDWIITENEVEALILENSLIKENKPKYNVRLKDDKSFPWLKITNDEFPTILITRTKKEDGAQYFGPYGDVGALRKTIKYIRKIFPVRNCTRTIGDESTRVCLDYHIDRCSGPCEDKIGKNEYQELIINVTRFLKGKNTTLLQELEDRMEKAAQEMQFEKAAALKEQITALRKTIKKQRVVLSTNKDQDIIGMTRNKERILVEALFVRDGRLVGKTHFPMEAGSEKSKRKILASFITQYYSKASFVPNRIITEVSIEDEQLLSAWLLEEKSKQVTITTPNNEKEEELVSMAKKNAEIHLDKHVKEEKIQSLKEKKKKRVLTQLQDTIGLETRPTIIEGYDVSNIQGAGSTGSKVCFRNGVKDQTQYRHYNLTIHQPNDYAMMQEVLRRRFKDTKEYPDLILVDGGKSQVSAAHEVLQEQEKHIPVIGLAKQSGTIYTRDGRLSFPNDSASFHLLQKIRDEAHRFAISYHRKLRRNTDSILDRIPGIGEKKKRRLMLYFGSLKKIKNASKKELQKVKGIGAHTAQKIHHVLQKKGKNKPGTLS